VLGAVDVLRTEIEKGKQPPIKPYKRPLTTRQWVVIAVQALSFAAAAIAAALFLDGPGALRWFMPFLIAAGVANGLQMLTIDDSINRTIDNPGLEIVSMDAPPPAPVPDPGLPERVQTWIRGRPIANLVLGFLLGIITNKASDLL
jgi:hypothetical protein